MVGSVKIAGCADSVDVSEPEVGLYANLRKYIDAIDELRDLGLSQEVYLPRIVVVGSQSAGKSSVMESLVGLPFLPRGTGVVTRVPLELRLIHEKNSQTYAQFHGSEKKYEDFEEVKKQIQTLTDEVAGTRRGIVDKPIVLTISGPKCPDLTLVDLPGIARVPLANTDQGDNIEKLTKDMAMKYCKEPETVILAVMPANLDLASSDGLRVSIDCDREGLRTIGVLTKIDLMDRGTHASQVLRGDEVQLALGYVAVKCRSQADIENQMSIQQSLVDEANYFRDHPIYKDLPKSMLGTKQLENKLTKVLFERIGHFMPKIAAGIQKVRKETRSAIARLGPLIPEEEQVRYISASLRDYCSFIKCGINHGVPDGSVDTYQQLRDVEEYHAGSTIRKLQGALLQEQRTADVTIEISDSRIQKEIDREPGINLDGLGLGRWYMILLYKCLCSLKDPISDYITAVVDAMRKQYDVVAREVFEGFPELHWAISGATGKWLEHNKADCSKEITVFLNSQLGFPFTNDDTWIFDHNGPRHKSKTEEKQPGLNIQEVRTSINWYYHRLVESLRDIIPRSVGDRLINKYLQGLCEALLGIEDLRGNPGRYLEEPEDKKQRRIVLAKREERLKRAASIVLGSFGMSGTPPSKPSTKHTDEQPEEISTRTSTTY